jgi:hypothetical protein
VRRRDRGDPLELADPRGALLSRALAAQLPVPGARDHVQERGFARDGASEALEDLLRQRGAVGVGDRGVGQPLEQHAQRRVADVAARRDGLEVAHLDHREPVAGADSEQIEPRDPLRGRLVDRPDLRADLVVEQPQTAGRVGKLEARISGVAHERRAEVLLVAILAPLGRGLARAVDEVGAAGVVDARRRAALGGEDLREALGGELRRGVVELGGLTDGPVVGERDQRMAQAAILR